MQSIVDLRGRVDQAVRPDAGVSDMDTDSIPAPTSDLNRTAVYEQLDTSHIAAFVRSQKNSSFGNLF